MPIRNVLRKNSRSESVKKLQKELNIVLKLKPALVEDRFFGKNTDAAVRQFQKKMGLKVDGIVGKATWNSLSNALNANKKITVVSYQGKLADIARDYLGVTETGNNQAGTNKKLLDIFNADDLVINGKTDGYPWCAAFVSHCTQMLLKNNAMFTGVIPPREASVSRFLNIWAKGQSCDIFKPNDKNKKPQKGDIAVFKFSHIGIVDTVYSGGVNTIEGNTNDSGSREGVTVAQKKRGETLIRAYIRLPVSISMMMDTNTHIQFC